MVLSGWAHRVRAVPSRSALRQKLSVIGGDWIRHSNPVRAPDWGTLTVATSIKVHQMTTSNGVMMRNMGDELEIKPGQTVELRIKQLERRSLWRIEQRSKRVPALDSSLPHQSWAFIGPLPRKRREPARAAEGPRFVIIEGQHEHDNEPVNAGDRHNAL